MTKVLADPPAPQIRRTKETLLFLAKIAVTLISFYVISRSVSWDGAQKLLVDIRFKWFGLAILIFWAAQIFSALRCVYVAHVLGGRLNLATSLHAHFVGLWFNQVLPTSLGGDVIKIAILRKPLGLSMAIRSAILDRLSGLMFLLLATAITLPLYANLFPSHPEWVITLGVIAVSGGLTIILGAWAAHCVSKLSILNPIFLKLIQIFSDVWAFKKGTPLWDQAWTSAIVHFNGIIAYILVGFALGANVNFIIFILVVPVIFLITAIPVSYAGWGIREVGSVWMFGMVGIDNELSLAMSVSFGLLLVVAGLPGLFIWVLKRE